MDGLSDDSMMGGELRAIESKLPPGFRFHPSDEELVCYYLRNKQQQQQQTAATMHMLVEVDLHACEPWDLPEVAKLGADEWYFFSFRDRKYATGWRRNRASKQGYWKATGKDKAILQLDKPAVAGARKTLVFYSGRAPNGRKTAWVMHEFRLLHHHDHHLHPNPNQEGEEDWVLCRVFRKGNNNGQAAGIVATCTTTPRPNSSSSAPTTTARHLHGLDSLISSPAPTVMSDQDRFSVQLHHQDSEHFFLDEQQQQQLLDLSVLQAPGDGGMEEIVAEMESFRTTCAALQDASDYYDQQLY